jgi:hypothetical protein
MAAKRALTLIDIPWLRAAARASGALDVPPGIATNLLKCGFVEHDARKNALTITTRGQLALTRLG